MMLLVVNGDFRSGCGGLDMAPFGRGCRHRALGLRTPFRVPAEMVQTVVEVFGGALVAPEVRASTPVSPGLLVGERCIASIAEPGVLEAHRAFDPFSDRRHV